jgi:hypothetical protein
MFIVAVHLSLDTIPGVSVSDVAAFSWSLQFVAVLPTRSLN